MDINKKKQSLLDFVKKGYSAIMAIALLTYTSICNAAYMDSEIWDSAPQGEYEYFETTPFLSFSSGGFKFILFIYAILTVFALYKKEPIAEIIKGLSQFAALLVFCIVLFQIHNFVQYMDSLLLSILEIPVGLVILNYTIKYLIKLKSK